MATHLTPEAFNSACSLMMIKAVEHRHSTVKANIAKKAAYKELKHFFSLGGNLLKVVKHESKYFFIEREVDGVSIIPKPGGTGIHITAENRHLLEGFLKHSPKPTTVVQWRQTFLGLL